VRIERDAELLNSVKYREVLARFNIDFDQGTLARELEQGVDRLSSRLVPCEIVTEPLAFCDFAKLNEVVAVLDGLCAQGTQESLIFAYGTHINPAVPDLAADTITGYLQGFLLIYDWIVKDSGTDFSRRHFTRFIDPYPAGYRNKVLAKDYRPNASRLIADYLTDNPTRNRALDMLPMFCEIDEQQVLAGVVSGERSLIKKRPTFHYRLPDCRVGDPEWSIASEWNRWWYVEVLAHRDELRRQLLDRWQRYQTDTLFSTDSGWVEIVAEFLATEIEHP
jgi:hypothetical protein